MTTQVAMIVEQYSAQIGLVLLIIIFAAFVAERRPPVVISVLAALGPKPNQPLEKRRAH